MKVVILCGGQGTRLREETEYRPKPLVEIGGRPILWHIMQLYSSQGFKDFILCLGYKGWLIKEYFLNYKAYTCDFTLQLGYDRAIEFHKGTTQGLNGEDWRVTFAETGLNTMTGGRVKRVARYIQGDDFMLTYGDGVADINLKDLYKFHREHGKLATVTAVSSPGRFGEIGVGKNNVVQRFSEKPSGRSLISGGFFIMKHEFLNYIPDDPATVLERGPLETLAAEGQLIAYHHRGFWHAMDTYRDALALNAMWESNQAAWKVWP